MIYLPNPNFDFEGCYKRPCPEIFPDLDEICKKFQKSRSSYWDKTYCKGYSFGFLREDGAEFAIRIITVPIIKKPGHPKWAVQGGGDTLLYWKDSYLDDEEFFDSLRDFLNDQLCLKGVP
jgi:hypothetical protein